MKHHTLTQGSAEWHAHRSEHFNASDAPAMMGCSPYKTRAQLLRELHTGLTAEVDAGQQHRFDDGHRFEALARPLAEPILKQELYPVVGSKGSLSASFDGLTMMEDVAWEHKSLNDELRAVLPAEGVGTVDVGDALPLHYRVQMQQQCMVSGAGLVLFTASKWTAEGELIEARHCWYESDPELAKDITEGWAQFDADLAAYVPPPAAEAAPVGRAPETLPALRIEVTGMVTHSNLAEFKETALAAIRSVNRELRTDADFADAEKAVKWCSEVEDRLKAAKEHALSQTASIDALFKTVDDISAEARRVRLDLDKLVTRRKGEVKDEAVLKARAALDTYIAALNAEIAPMRLQPVAADFAGAIKGKRSIDSMQDALDTTLAQAKIAADGQARGIRANLATFKALAEGSEFLFSDLGQVVHKPAEDFTLLVKSRIDAHKLAEAQRLERERERIRAEEAAKLQREAEAAERAAAIKRAAEAEEVTRAGIAAHAAAQAAAAPAPAVTAAAFMAIEAPRRPATTSEPAPMMTLGTICKRLRLTVTGDLLAELGYEATVEKNAKLYREADFRGICQAISAHVLLAPQLEAVAA